MRLNRINLDREEEEENEDNDVNEEKEEKEEKEENEEEEEEAEEEEEKSKKKGKKEKIKVKGEEEGEGEEEENEEDEDVQEENEYEDYHDGRMMGKSAYQKEKPKKIINFSDLKNIKDIKPNKTVLKKICCIALIVISFITFYFYLKISLLYLSKLVSKNKIT